jgi:cyanate permease
MAQQIRRFGVGQTAKVVGVLYTLMGLLVVPIFALAAIFAPESERPFPLWLVACLPFVYGLLGLVFSSIACLVYNMVAGWVGGIEVEVEETA